MICTHQFFKLSETSKMPPNVHTGLYRAIPGVEVICIKCGQMRKGFADGTVELTREGGRPIDEDGDSGRA